jgi:hypothetical protein
MFQDTSIIAMVNMLMLFLAGVTVSASATVARSQTKWAAPLVDWSFREPVLVH